MNAERMGYARVLAVLAVSLVVFLGYVIPASGALVTWKNSSGTEGLWYTYCCLGSTNGGYHETPSLFIGNRYTATSNGSGFWDVGSCVGCSNVSNTHGTVGNRAKNWCKWTTTGDGGSTTMICKYRTP